MRSASRCNASFVSTDCRFHISAVKQSLPQERYLLEALAGVKRNMAHIRSSVSFRRHGLVFVFLIAVSACLQTQAAGDFTGTGLWDAHTHLSFYGPNALDSLKAHNVVAIRDLGANKLDEILRWRSEIAAGIRQGPRIFTAGVILDGPKEDSANRWTLRTEADAAHAVDSLAKRRVDFIKTHNGLSRPVYFAVLRTAKAHKLKVASHLPRGVPAWEAADSGASSIEHAAESMMASSIYAGYAKDFAEAAAWWKSPAGHSAIGRIKRSGVYFTPTLALYAANVNLPTDSAARAGRGEALKALVELTRLMHKAGIPIMAGSDIAVPRQDYRPGQALKEEMTWLRRAGLSESEVKRAAGKNIARWLERRQ